MMQKLPNSLDLGHATYVCSAVQCRHLIPALNAWADRA